MGVRTSGFRRLASRAGTALVLGLFLTAAGVRAQVGPVAEIPEADSLFQTALAHFASEQYVEAAGIFSQVAQAYPLHVHTTAAAFMEARALYRAGAWRESAEAYERFMRQYPSSRYLADARRAHRLARDAADADESSPLTLGIVLSLDPDEASQSQELFSGLRLAVDAHNAVEGRRPIRMVFRDIDALGPDGAVSSAAAAGATLVVGALFSDQARAAAAAAERERVVFLAPLATDHRVSEGRRYAFQANPTIPMRGRLMARFAVNGLLQRDLAVIAQRDEVGISELMAGAFAEEARSLGARVHLVHMFEDTAGWLSVGRDLTRDSLANVRALYAPLAGDQADRLAGGLLNGLDILLGAGVAGELARVRVLGNAEWHDLPIQTHASRYQVTYTNDYHLDPRADETQAFVRRFRALTGDEPGRLAVVGYDLGTFLSRSVHTTDASAIAAGLRDAAAFVGLGIRLDFGGGQVNRTMFYHRYRDGAVEILR